MATSLQIALLIGLVVALVFVGVPVIREERRTRRAAHSRPLPHRPAPDAPPPSGARHRIDDAHTASYSAAAVLQALREEADQRDVAMRRRGALPPVPAAGPSRQGRHGR